MSTLVTGNTYRNPAMLAKAVTTLDVVSGGRVVAHLSAFARPRSRSPGRDTLGEEIRVGNFSGFDSKELMLNTYEEGRIGGGHRMIDPG